MRRRLTCAANASTSPATLKEVIMYRHDTHIGNLIGTATSGTLSVCMPCTQKLCLGLI